jgi:putative ABC transport system permease protein
VRERSAEVAVMKTLGFRRTQILAMFVGESVGVALLGGLLGVGGAKLLFGSLDWYTFTNGIIQHFNVAPSTMAIGLAAAILLGVVSAAVPAWQASRQSIVTALRHVG